MHKKKETLDTRLLKILKNGYPKIHNICKKLEENDNDITILSSTELDGLWYTIKHLLKELQNLSKPRAKPNGNSVRSKEYNACSKTYSSIVKIALQTLKFDDVPNVLLDVLILLNLALPEISDQKVKDEMSTLLEECWKLDPVWGKNAIINALKYLSKCAQTSLQHVKRLNDVKHAIPLLKSCEDVQNVMKLVRQKTLLALAEGRELLVHLFSLGEVWIMGIYNNIRVSLQTADSNCVKAYSDILIKTWQNTTAENRKTVEECLKNLIFHCLRAQRDINGRGKLGENLLTFLQFFHSQTNNAVKRMICDQYLELLWRCLEAPGCYVRCNAADVLFLAYPMSVTNAILKTNSSLKNKLYLRKQHSAITNLLKDLSEKVCLIALKGMFHVLGKFWVSLPPELIDEWLNIVLEHTKSSNCPEIRKSVFQGLKSLLSNPHSNGKLKEILPKFADSIYDTNVDVKTEVLELILEIHNRTKVQIWDIVPLNCIIECLDATSHKKIVDLFHQLLWNRFFFTKDLESTVLEIIDTGQVNINVVRKFFLHSKGIIVSENAFKLINAILSTMTHEIELLPEKEISEDVRVKRHKSSETKEIDSRERSNHLTNGVNQLSTIQILVDVSALLYAVNSEEFLKDTFNSEMKELNSKIAQKMHHILEKFEDQQLSETAVFFLSLIPENIVENCEELSEECKRKLLDLNVSDDMILSILHLLVKWDKLESVLQLLLSLLKVDKNLQLRLAPIAEFGKSDKSEAERIRMLKLGLRILEFLLRNEFHSFLVENYHESMIEFWDDLNFIKTLMEDRYANNNENSYVLPGEILKVLFKQYVSLIPLLHHSDKFRASRHFSKIVTWAQEEVVLRASGVTDLETDEFSISILKCLFETSNGMIAQFKASPKLCCEIIILYCKCLMAKCGIAFVNDALVTVLCLMQLSSDICSNEESKLLKVVPSLFAAVMVTLTKYPVDLVKKYTNNLKSLEDLIKNLFATKNNSLTGDDFRLGYMAIVFNTAVFCLSKDLEKLLSDEQFTSVDLFHHEFPFISEAILKIVVRGEGFQDFCIEVLSKAVSKYNTIDLLSSLLIIKRLIKLRNKTALKKRLKKVKNIVSSAKEQIQESIGKNSCTVRERLVSDATNKMIQEILKS